MKLIFKLNTILLLIVIASTSYVKEVHSADVPLSGIILDLNVREQTVAEFVRTLFQEIDVPVVVADDLEGIVNGRFTGAVAEILDRVSTTFDVIFYFDGAVAHVYPSNTLNRSMLRVESDDAKRVIGLVERTELLDELNTLESEDGGLLVSGVPRFIVQIKEFIELVRSIEEKTVANSAPPVPKKIPAVVKRLPDDDISQILPRDNYTYKVFKLKYAWAGDTTVSVGNRSVTVPGIATLLNELISNSTTIPKNIDITSNENQVNGLRGEGLSKEKQTVADKTVSKQMVSRGKVRIIADSRLNAIIIGDTQERLGLYQPLIDSLDVSSEMVEIEATIIDINSDKSRELGVDWRYSFDDGEVLFSKGAGDSFSATGPGGVLTLASPDGAEFLSRLRLLESKGAARVVSKPHLVTLSNVEGVLGTTTEFFVRIAGDEEVDLFNVPVGTILRVTPHVFSDADNNKKIRLFLNIEDGAESASGQTVDGIPVIRTSTINTQAVVEDGASLLIGGLARQTFATSETRIPLLGSIPLLGRMFRNTINSTSRVERLFLITPRVSNNEIFEARANVPTLLGDSLSDDVSEYRRNLDSLKWPLADNQHLWPTKVEKQYKNKNNASVLAGLDSVVDDAMKPASQPAEFKSPFGVEYWTLDYKK